MLDETLR